MKNMTRILLFVVFIPLAILLVIIIHEIGHVAVARLFGDNQASYFLYKRYPNGGFCIGCYTFGVLSDRGTLFVKIGGVIFTQFFFIAILTALKTKIVNFVPRLATTILAVLFFLDLPFQVLQGFRPSPDAPKSGIDFADFSQLVSLQTNLSAFSIRIALVIAFVIYLLLMMWLYRTRSAQISNNQSIGA
jgi:hypothetical protein